MPPTLVVTVLLGSLYGLVFFLLAGSGGGRNVFYYWATGAVGCLIGQVIGEYVSVSSARLGDVRLVEASIVCWVFLFALYNLGPVKLRRRS